LKLAKEDLPPEVYADFRKRLLNQYQGLRSTSEGFQEVFLSLLLPPARIPLSVFVQLTDWQLVFLYLIPIAERNLREIETLAEAESKYG